MPAIAGSYIFPVARMPRNCDNATKKGGCCCRKNERITHSVGLKPSAKILKRQEVLQQCDPFLEVWYPHLLRYVCRFATSRSTAEDVVQDVFLDHYKYKALTAGQRIEFPKAWTMRVARRKCA
jgi:hypothetical protein